MPTSSFVRWGGIALTCAGVMTALINVVLTPMLPAHTAFSTVASSRVFFWRESLSALAASLLLLGSVALYLPQAVRTGVLGAIAFLLAFWGSALLLGVEWTQLFDVRDFARSAPAALDSMNARKGFHWSDAGALAVLATFTAGWIALAICTLRSRTVGRIGPWLVIVGLFATPLMTPMMPGRWGASVGNLILGSGFVLLGYGCVRRSP